MELLAPVRATELRERLDGIFDVELADPSAWMLAVDGTYTRRVQADGSGESAQARFAAELVSRDHTAA